MFYKFQPSFAFPGFFVSLAITASLSACAAKQVTPAPQTTTIKSQSDALQSYAFKKGQLLSFISVASKDTPEAKQALQQYYTTAFPLAEKHGLKREGQLRVKANPLGDHKSEGVVIYSWPDQKSEQRMDSEGAWPEIKKLRPLAWEELRIYTAELEDDLTLTFDPKKTYTLAVMWSNPENPDHYRLYLDGIKDAIAESGGRIIYKMFDPKFESNKIKDGGPGQVTLLEWDSADGLFKLGDTEGFKQNEHYLKSGVRRYEIIALGTS